MSSTEAGGPSEVKVATQGLSFESDRLLFSALKLEDEGDLFEYQSDAMTVRFIPWPARTRQQVREALENTLLPRTFAFDNDYLLFGWRLKENAKVIGQSNISITSQADSTAEIGWVLHPEFAGKGFASEATKALITFAFDQFKFHRITAYIDQRNDSSVKLAERVGMRREAAYIKDEFFKGEWSSAYLYAILDEEWQNSERS